MPVNSIAFALLELTFDPTCQSCWSWPKFQENTGLTYPPWSETAAEKPPKDVKAKDVSTIRAFVNAWIASNDRDTFFKARMDQNAEGRTALRNWGTNQYRKSWRFSQIVEDHLNEIGRMPHQLMEAMGSTEVRNTIVHRVRFYKLLTY